MLTQGQADAILQQLDASTASVLAKAQANVDDFKAGSWWKRAVLTTFSGGGEIVREDELQKQLQAAQDLAGGLEQLRGLLPAALDDAAMGDRWLQAAKSMESRMQDADGFIAAKTIDQILTDSLKTAGTWAQKGVEAVASAIPWWVYVGLAVVVLVSVAPLLVARRA